MTSRSILDHFSTLEDLRQAWKVTYPLPEVLLLVLCGTLSGADDFVETETSGEEKLDFLRRFLLFKAGIPSHDTLYDVMNALPSNLLADCFASWMATLRESNPNIVSIDAETSRRAHASDGRPLHLISTWANRQRLVLGQEAFSAKQSESCSHGTKIPSQTPSKSAINDFQAIALAVAAIRGSGAWVVFPPRVPAALLA